MSQTEPAPPDPRPVRPRIIHLECPYCGWAHILTCTCISTVEIILRAHYDHCTALDRARRRLYRRGGAR